MVDKVDKIWLDGKLIPWEQANVHILTHTLHYGLGVFEGIRCYQTAEGPAVNLPGGCMVGQTFYMYNMSGIRYDIIVTLAL